MKITFPYRHKVLAFLTTLAAITYLDRICISIVGVRIKAEFGLSNEQFGWVLGAFALAYAIFEIPSGILGDRIGPKTVFIRIVIIWSLFTSITGLVNGLIALIIVRFLFGMGESGTYPNIMIVMSRWIPENEMGRSLSWIGIGSQLGSAIAPLIIIPLASAFGWRMPFYVNVIIGLIWVLVCIFWFRDFPSEMRRISEKEKSYIETNCRSISQKHFIDWKIIFKSRSLFSLMLMYFCFQWGNYFFVAWLPIYLQEGRHFTENGMKSVLSLIFIAGIGGMFSVGYAVD